MSTKGSIGSGRAIATGLIAIVIAGCGGPAGTQRPTEPRQIAIEAVRATAGLPTLRLHVEAGSAGGTVAGQSRITIDADIDLANRQLAGRIVSSSGAPPGAAPGAVAPDQSVEVIITADALYSRTGGTARWTKASSLNLAAAQPTNAAIAAAIAELLADERLTFDKLDTVDCTLGSCDHVVIHLDGTAAAEALARLVGGAPGNVGSIPNTDIAIRVDRSSSVVSELRAIVGSGDGALQLLATITSPGAALRIVAPDPGLVDDNTGGVFHGEPATAVPVPAPATPAP